MKKLVSVLLVLALSLTLFSIPAFAAEKTVVDLWIQPWDTFQQEWLNDWVDVYNSENEAVEINVTFVPDSAWTEKLVSMISAG